MTACRDCTRAQAMRWRHYSSGCAECDIRWLADLDSAQRPAVFEQIGAQVGEAALRRIKELVGLEIARQRMLRDGVRRQEKGPGAATAPRPVR